MNSFLASIAAIIAALTLATASPAAAQEGQCLSRAQTQNLVNSGQILTLDDVLRYAGIGPSDQVLSVSVCEQGGTYYYVIGVIDAYGSAKNLTLNAVTGSQ